MPVVGLSEGYPMKDVTIFDFIGGIFYFSALQTDFELGEITLLVFLNLHSEVRKTGWCLKKAVIPRKL